MPRENTHEMTVPTTTVTNNSDGPQRKLSDMLTQQLEPLSPLQVDFPDPKFGTAGNNLNHTEEPTTAHARPETAGVGSSEPVVAAPPAADADIELRKNKSHDFVGDTSNVRYREHERGSWVNIKLVKGSRASADSYLDGGGGRGGGMEGELRPEDRGKMVGSLDRVSAVVGEGEFVVS